MPVAVTSSCLASDALISSQATSFSIQVTWVLNGGNKEGKMENNSVNKGTTDLRPDHQNGFP